MMKTYKVDGVTYSVQDEEDLVRQMNEASFDPRPTAEEYMFEVAERTTLQSGGKPRVDSHENFVADLVEAGLVEEVL